MPGHRSQIIRLQDRGIGVVVMTTGGYRNHPVALLSARRVLELEPVDWERRLLHDSCKSHDETEKLSKAPCAPTVGQDDIPGVYRHPGYPILEVVRFDRASKDHQLWVRDLPATMSGEQRLTFFGLMPHSLHVPVMAITHHNGNVFEYATLFRTYASDGSEKIVPFELGPKRAVFVNGKLGFGSNFVAVSQPHKYNAGECPMTGQSGDEGGVDIWFDKVLE